jgi:hypothetical protein
MAFIIEMLNFTNYILNSVQSIILLNVPDILSKIEIVYCGHGLKSV